jgi:nucleoside-triphosphatase THEP1
VLLGRVKERRPEKSLLLTGLRGVGKTVLLNEIELLAENAVYRTVAGAHRSADIARALGVNINSLGPGRAKLIQKGMIYSPTHGNLAFTVPLFDEFMLRAMPEF